VLSEETTNTKYRNPTQSAGLEQSGTHRHIIENQLVLAMISLKNC
jgi:hypothetical protein